MKDYKTYLTIYGTLKGKRKPTSIEIDLTDLDVQNQSCPVMIHVKATQALFKVITKRVSRQYGYREEGNMVFRDLFPVNEYVFDHLWS